MGRSKSKDDVIVVKKYANRRLYDTARSSYITLKDISEMIKDDLEFVVYDAKSGEDITRSVLAQIVLEQESEHENMLPTDFMRQLIGLYGESVQSMVPSYLAQAMDSFMKNQEQFRDQINESINMFSMDQIQEMNKRNMQMMQKTMSMFPIPGMDAFAGTPEGSKDRVSELEDTIQKLQEELNSLKN